MAIIIIVVVGTLEGQRGPEDQFSKLRKEVGREGGRTGGGTKGGRKEGR